MSYTVTLKIPNISCHHCTMTIERETKELAGVEQVKGNVEDRTATFTVSDEETLNAVKETLAEIGYPAAG